MIYHIRNGSTQKPHTLLLSKAELSCLRSYDFIELIEGDEKKVLRLKKKTTEESHVCVNLSYNHNYFVKNVLILSELLTLMTSGGLISVF